MAGPRVIGDQDQPWGADQVLLLGLPEELPTLHADARLEALRTAAEADDRSLLIAVKLVTRSSCWKPRRTDSMAASMTAVRRSLTVPLAVALGDRPKKGARIALPRAGAMQPGSDGMDQLSTGLSPVPLYVRADRGQHGGLRAREPARVEQ